MQDEFSTVDGFMEITESLADMIKYLANEPSVGLFYVQQHTQNAIPNLVALKNNVDTKSRSTTLHAEDTEESITMVGSMKECGFPITDEMIRDIKRSLAILSTKQPKRGLLRGSSSSFDLGRTSSWGPSTWARDERPGSTYFSTVLKSAKQKASNFKWPQFESGDVAKRESFVYRDRLTPSVDVLDMESELPELPLSIHAAYGEVEEEVASDDKLKLGGEEMGTSFQPVSNIEVGGSSGASDKEDYDEFRADKEAKLKEWLNSGV